MISAYSQGGRSDRGLVGTKRHIPEASFSTSNRPKVVEARSGAPWAHVPIMIGCGDSMKF